MYLCMYTLINICPFIFKVTYLNVFICIYCGQIDPCSGYWPINSWSRASSLGSVPSRSASADGALFSNLRVAVLSHRVAARRLMYSGYMTYMHYLLLPTSLSHPPWPVDCGNWPQENEMIVWKIWFQPIYTAIQTGLQKPVFSHHLSRGACWRLGFSGGNTPRPTFPDTPHKSLKPTEAQINLLC